MKKKYDYFEPTGKHSKAGCYRKGGKFYHKFGCWSEICKNCGKPRSKHYIGMCEKTIGFLSGHLLRAYEMAELDNKLEEIKSVIDDRTPKRKR